MRFSRASSPLLIYLLHSGNLYGTERMALATLESMNEYAARLVVAPEPSGIDSVAVAARNAGYHTAVFRTKWELFRCLAPWFMRYRNIDVIGVGVGSSLMCYAMGWMYGVRLRQLQVVHGGTPYSYIGRQRLNAIPIAVVAVSDFVKTKLLTQGVRPERIVVIDNFLSAAQRLQYQRRPSYLPGAGGRPLDPTHVRVAIVSRVDGVKKLRLVVEAVERFGLDRFRFDIYGAGEELAELRMRSLPLTNVEFHGYVRDVDLRMRAADLLLHLCPEEPFGLVILEAFASGVVVIVPDAGGAGDLVEDGVTGFRFRADDVEDMVDVLAKASSTSAAGLQQIADAAVAALDNRYSAAGGVEQYRVALALFQAPTRPSGDVRRWPQFRAD